MSLGPKVCISYSTLRICCWTVFRVFGMKRWVQRDFPALSGCSHSQVQSYISWLQVKSTLTPTAIENGTFLYASVHVNIAVLMVEADLFIYFIQFLEAPGCWLQLAWSSTAESMWVRVCRLGLPIFSWARFYSPWNSSGPTDSILSFPQVPSMEKETTGAQQGAFNLVSIWSLVSQWLYIPTGFLSAQCMYCSSSRHSLQGVGVYLQKVRIQGQPPSTVFLFRLVWALIVILSTCL